MSNLYIHTISGKPAMYMPDEQIVSFNRYARVKFSEVFVTSLEKIRAQQKASANWRSKRGYGAGLAGDYGYIRVENDSGAEL